MRVPPRDPKRRRRYFALLAKARTAPPHQRAKLLAVARGLLERAEGQPLRGSPQL
jgi:hypothetical protein